MERIIDLHKYRTSGSRVFAGRPRGEYARAQEDLDDLDLREDVTIEVRVPADTFSINSSFFLGMFGDSIRHLGEEEFRRRFIFNRPVGRVYESAIQEALTTSSPLSPAGLR